MFTAINICYIVYKAGNFTYCYNAASNILGIKYVFIINVGRGTFYV